MGVPRVRRRLALTEGLAGRWLAAAAVSAVLLTVYLSTLAPGLTWANQGADGGDLIAAAATGGVSHPTGYPTYLLAARVFLWLPLGSLAYRTNLLSATAAALAAGLVSLAVAEGYAGRPSFARIAGPIAGLAFGLSPALWSQAVITEVYTLHALLTGASLAIMLSGTRDQEVDRSPWAAASGLLLGLAMGNHLTAALLLPAWLAGIARDAHRKLWLAAMALAGLALGLLVYAAIPLSARAGPAINWGGADEWEGFSWLVSGQAYRGLILALPARLVWPRIAALLATLRAQLGWTGLALAAAGLCLGRASSPRVRGLIGWIVVSFSGFAILYAAPDFAGPFLPAILGVTVAFGLGLATALERVGGAPWGRWAVPLAAGIVFGLLLIGAARHLPEVDARRDSRAEAFGRGVMDAAPKGAMIFTFGDRDTFALWYFHFALGERPDVAVLAEPMLGFAWYRESLRTTYPALAVPDRPAGTWKLALRAANDWPACETHPDDTLPLACLP